VIRRLLAWLRTWGAMESTGRYAWGPDDPPADDLTDARDAGIEAAQDASDSYVNHVIARMEAQFDTNEEAGP
jgi:hypothetical protein